MDERLNKHLELVIEANKHTNLTRITSWEEAQVLHIEDSLSALDEINEAPEGKYGDMGTGAGFPGVPLAIMTGRETVLMDSVGKKTKILDQFIEELGLVETVRTYNGRLEDLALSEKGTYSVLTARALSKLGSLMELSAPLLKMHGQLICYKSHVEDEELAHARNLEKLLGMRIVKDRSFVLSDEITMRRIIVFEKFAKPRLRLPRPVGHAQKKPL